MQRRFRPELSVFGRSIRLSSSIYILSPREGNNDRRITRQPGYGKNHSSGSYHFGEGELSLVELPQEMGRNWRSYSDFLELVGSAGMWDGSGTGPSEEAFVENMFGRVMKMISVAKFKNLKLKRVRMYRDGIQI